MEWKARGCFIPHQLSKQSNKSTTSAAEQGQSTHTAALQLAQRTVANIINHRITDARDKHCRSNPWQLTCVPPSRGQHHKKK